MAPRRAHVLLAPLLLACVAASGCGGGHVAPVSTQTAGQAVAERFARAIFRGDAPAAIALLAPPPDAALSSLASRAAAAWKPHHGMVRTPGARSGSGWVFRYAGIHPQADGRFEQVRGDLVVTVAATSSGTGVRGFAFVNEHVRFRTHHDSVLLPSDR